MELSFKTLSAKIVLSKITAMILSSRIVLKILESKKSSSRIIMISGALTLLLLFVLPLWNIQLEAPQYPIPLGLDIYIHKFADEAPNDIMNINLLNHYVGMKKIPEHIPEFDIFPLVIITMSLLGVIVGLAGKHKLYLGWLIVMMILCFAGLYDFYQWEYDYGHNLDPHAILKFTNEDGTAMGFQPPVLGTKHILNFVANSYPASGGYALFVSLMLAFTSYKLGSAGFKEEKDNTK